MSTHKYFDRICIGAVVFALLITLVFMNGAALGIQAAEVNLGYEDRLFDTSRVHTVDIVMDDWDSFLDTCENEEYANCSVVIDGEAYKNVGIRAKGNTSLSTVSSLNSDRYSFKLEFDQYDSTQLYHGLDKLCLNNLIQDYTMMKDYLTYQMMLDFGVAAPLCSYVYITVNGEDWGLYLAVEGIEESFLRRNYGNDYGDLYKPDSMSMGGGRGNGMDFNMDDFMNQFDSAADGDTDSSVTDSTVFDPTASDFTAVPGMGGMGSFDPTAPEDFDPASANTTAPEGFDPSSMEIPHNASLPGQMGDMSSMGGMNAMGSSDVMLQYTDDDPDSYSNIFSSAKTDVTSADKTRLIGALEKLSSYDTSALDMESVLRYFVVHNFVVNGDSYTGSMIHNYYLYEEDGTLSMIPWDYNLAFGTFQSSSASSAVNDPIDTPLSVTGSGDRPMIDWIFSDESYTELYHQYFREFLETVDIDSLITETAARIAPYVERDPTKFCTTEEFETAVEALRTFCQLRTESVAGQLDGSIPATDSEQTGAALIDTGDLELSAMGSMGNTMGGGMGGRQEMPTDGSGFGSRGDVQIPDAPETTEEAADGLSATGLSFGGFGGAQPTSGDTTTEGQGGFQPGGMQGGQIPDASGEFPGGDMTGDFPGGDMTGEATGETTGDTMIQMPDMDQMGNAFTGNFGNMEQTAGTSDTTTLILLLVSVIVLGLGLLVAFLYKK